MMMNLDLIKPDASGKYSPLLYKWLRSPTATRRRFQQVFQIGSCDDRTVYSGHWRPREIIIGRGAGDGYVSGRALSDIIGAVRGVQSNSYAYHANIFNAREITDEFWRTYERIGRCAWDAAHSLHMIGDENRYTPSADGRHRTCNWCGAEFEGHARQRVEVTRWTEWRAVEVP